jgi:exodeoxyribonuclease VII large subunit
MQRLKSAPVTKILTETLLLDRLETSTRHLDPANVLKRGFSITRLNGKIITKATEAKAGDKLNTTLHEGTLESEVRRIV